MTPINNALYNIINGKYNFCCLCLQAVEEPIHFENEVVLDLNSTERRLTMSDILRCVLGDEVYKETVTFSTLCDQCSRSCINGYMFINTCKENLNYLNYAVDGLVNCFEHTNDEYECKTLFVAFNNEDFSSEQFYDNSKRISSSNRALKRFKSMFDIKSTYKKEKNSYLVIPIRTEDMMLNKNDLNNIKCKVCYKKYPTLWNLRNHYIRVHAPKVFKCSECPRSYGSQAFLEAHKTESHCTVVCKECGKTFHNRHTLKMHEIGHHFKIICSDCGRVYKSHNSYKKHFEMNVCGQQTRASPADAKFECDYCHKKYTQKMSLRVHIQHEHGNYKSHECEWCHKKFWAISRLKAHIVTHTREKKFHCTTCNRKFVTKEALLYHTRIHTGETPYPCPYCDKRFLSVSRRTDHVKRLHTGPRIECEICKKKFSNKSHFNKHKMKPCVSEFSKKQMKVKKQKTESNMDISDLSEYEIITENGQKLQLMYKKSDSNTIHLPQKPNTNNMATTPEVHHLDLVDQKEEERENIEFIYKMYGNIGAQEVTEEIQNKKTEVSLHYSNQIEEDTQQLSEEEVYLEVLDDEEDYPIKIEGIN